jgi:hypothetical protein
LLEFLSRGRIHIIDADGIFAVGVSMSVNSASQVQVNPFTYALHLDTRKGDHRHDCLSTVEDSNSGLGSQPLRSQICCV